jgi:hypothetical protein
MCVIRDAVVHEEAYGKLLLHFNILVLGSFLGHAGDFFRVLIGAIASS